MSEGAEEWVHPWEWAASDLPDDDLLCDECLTGGPGLTVWTTLKGELLKTLHGACMRPPLVLP